MQQKTVSGTHATYRGVELIASEIEQKLTPAACATLKDLLAERDLPAWELVVRSAVLFLRTGRISGVNTLFEEVRSKRCSFQALYNSTWIKFMKDDINRDGDIEYWVKRHSQTPSEADTSKSSRFSPKASTFVEGGNSTSLTYLSNSISYAVLNHDVVPSDTTLSNLVLVTLRMIPADLKSLRQEVVHKSAPAHEMELLKEEASRDETSAEAAKHHDLTPSSETGYLSSLNSIYESNAPILRRPIPTTRSHKHVRDALGPMWDLLKEFSPELSLPNVVTLLRGFNKATLVTPTLFLLPQVARHTRGDPKTAAEGFYYALKTLCADVQYDEAYKVYCAYLRPKNAEHPTWKFVLEHRRLLSFVLQSVSRASAATRAEKEKLFELALTHNALTGDSLASFTYAMSRDATVSVKELSAIYERCRGLPLERHEARFMNDIFFGFSARGAFNLAHSVLGDMWEKGATISAQSIRLFLERCIQARQVDLVEDIFNLMRPESPVDLYRDAKKGRRSETTSRKLPVSLKVPAEAFQALLALDIQLNHPERFVQHITDYATVENYPLTRDLLIQLLSVAMQSGRVSLLSPILAAFEEKAGITPDLRALNAMIGVHVRARDAQGALERFASIKKLGMEANEFTFVALMRVRALSSIDAAIDILTEMKEANVPATAAIFEALLDVIAPGSSEKAEWMLAHMEDIGVKPTLGVYKPILTAYAKAGNGAMFQQHLKHIVESSGLPLEPFFCASLIDSLALLGDFESLHNWLLPIMRREGIELSLKMVGQLLLAYYRLDKPELAEEILKDLPSRHRVQTQAKLASIVFLPSLRYLALHDLPRAWKLIDIMEKQCGVPVGQDMLTAILTETETPNSTRRAEALAWMKENLHPLEFQALENTVKAQSL